MPVRQRDSEWARKKKRKLTRSQIKLIKIQLEEREKKITWESNFNETLNTQRRMMRKQAHAKRTNEL